MKRWFVIPLLALLLGPALEAAAQQYPFRTYSIEKGLSEAVVNDMIQDEEGYLWIATSYGLNRFNGFSFRNYYEENGLLSNDIQSLYQDRQGRIWIGTTSGINVMEDDTITTKSALDPLRESAILEIFQDQEGRLWFATDGEGVWELDPPGTLTQHLPDEGLADARVRDVAQDSSGTIWFATRGGLSFLEEGNFRTYTTEDGLADNLLRDLLPAPDGSIWIATRGGLSHLEEGAFTNYTEEDDSLINNRIQSLSFDENYHIWLGTEEGASYFADGRFTNYSVEEGLSNNIIHSTLIDRENNIWFGTFGGGISVFLGDHIRNFTVEDGLPNNVITSVVQDNLGEHWITTYGGGIAHYEDGRFVVYNEPQGLVDNKVYTADISDHGELLIGTRWGLSIFNGIRFFNFDEGELPYRKIRAVHNASRGIGFWLGTYGEGLLHYNEKEFVHYTEEDGLADNTVMTMEEDDEGALWVGTYGGVSRLDPVDPEFENYTILDGLPNNVILDIQRARNGDMWFSTSGGIARFSGGEITSITSEDGLPDEVGYFILQDEEGYFWIGTKIGVVRFDADSYSESMPLREKRKAFKLITRNQGLVANEMNASAGYRDDEGYLWFGSVGGLTRLDPSQVSRNTVPPKVQITGVSISGERRESLENLEIGSDSHNITFNFIGLNFSAPEQVVYEYRIRNSGDEWQRTTQRQVQHSAFLPGSYEFEVRAINEDGVVSSAPARISFDVLAPFWLQGWFIGLVILLLLGIVVFIYNYYRVRKMVELERMRVRIASDLHDDVGSALTEIALQSDFLQTMDVREDLRETLDQIGDQSRKIVSSLDDIVWSIDARNDTLGDLTDRMQDYINHVLPEREVRYEFDGLDMNRTLDVPMKENLYLIFKEAVNNIAKHSDATKVTVRLAHKQNGEYDLVVKDNGSGSRNARKSGQGMRNMKMRAQRIDADITFTNTEGFTVHVSGQDA